MPEIILPTKQQVDGIKQDTQQILNNFPITGGVDWSKKSPLITRVTHYNASEYQTVLISTGSGYITSISQILTSKMSENVFTRIEIDGRLIFDGVSIHATRSTPPYNVSITFAQLLRFSKSLRIYHRTGSSSDDYTNSIVTIVSCVLD